MKNYIRKLGIASICISILLIIISLFMINKPMETVAVVIVLLGYILVIDGLIHLVSYFNIKDEYRYFSFELAESIIYVILGFLIVKYADTVETILPTVIGIWIVIQGINEIQIAFNIRGIHGVEWGLVLLLSLVSVALGVGIIFKPNVSFDIIIRLAGAVLLYSQIINLYDNIYFIIQVKDIKKEIKKIQDAGKEQDN